MLRAIVIDDEESGIDVIKLLAQRCTHLIKIVASSSIPQKGIELIEDYKPDIVFLDINMPTMDGFELLTQLSFKDFKLVFTTAHRDYAISAIKIKAFDYLLKPIDYLAFKLCLEEIQKLTSTKSHSLQPTLTAIIELQVKDGIVYIKQNEIIRLEASRNYTEFYLDNGQRHIASRNLKEFETKLDSKLFYRCHKSHIINLQKVKKFINHDGLFVLMIDGSTPDVSKQNKEELLELLKHS